MASGLFLVIARGLFRDSALEVYVELGECPYGGGLCRPFLAAYKDSAERRVDYVEDQSLFHILLSDDGGKIVFGLLIVHRYPSFR